MFYFIGDHYQIMFHMAIAEALGLEIKDEALTNVEDFLVFLRAIWIFKFPGFWNYYFYLTGLGICSKERFVFAVRVLNTSRAHDLVAETK